MSEYTAFEIRRVVLEDAVESSVFVGDPLDYVRPMFKRNDVKFSQEWKGNETLGFKVVRVRRGDKEFVVRLTRKQGMGGARFHLSKVEGDAIDLTFQSFEGIKYYLRNFDESRWGFGLDFMVYDRKEDRVFECARVYKHEGVWYSYSSKGLTGLSDTKNRSQGDFRPAIDYVVNAFLGSSNAGEFLVYDGKKIVNCAASILFTPAEAAEFNLGRWVSVPRLNLGPTVHPVPGLRDVSNDEIVISGAPLLVERLASLGSMSREEAERVVEQKLLNYFVHQTGFQSNRANAVKIIDSLKKKPLHSKNERKVL